MVTFIDNNGDTHIVLPELPNAYWIDEAHEEPNHWDAVVGQLILA